MCSRYNSILRWSGQTSDCGRRIFNLKCDRSGPVPMALNKHFFCQKNARRRQCALNMAMDDCWAKSRSHLDDVNGIYPTMLLLLEVEWCQIWTREERSRKRTTKGRLIDSRKFLGVLKYLLSMWVKGLKCGARTLEFSSPRMVNHVILGELRPSSFQLFSLQVLK